MIKEKSVENIKEISLNITQSKIDSVRKKDITKTGIRFYEDGYVGFAGAIGNIDEKELEKKALSSLEDKFLYPYELCKNISEYHYYNKQLRLDDVVAEFDEVMAILEKEQPNFTFSNKINVVEVKKCLSNTSDLDLLYKDRYIIFSIIIKEKTSVNILDSAIEFVSRKYDRDLFISYVNKVCNAYKNRVDFEGPKKYPVVFRTNEQLPLVKLMQDLHGGLFGSKSSLLSDKLGEKVFSEDFTLYQNNDPKDSPVCFFDDEGVVNENYRYTLIEKGVVKSPYTDKRTSNKYELPLTGSSDCEYDGIASIGIPDFKIKESDKTVKELLDGQLGIYVDISMGGDFTADGSFGAPVQVAYLFDGKEFLGRLPELNISSNVFDMFGKDYVGVSCDCINELCNDKFLVMNMDVSLI